MMDAGKSITATLLRQFAGRWQATILGEQKRIADRRGFSPTLTKRNLSREKGLPVTSDKGNRAP